MRKWQSTPVLSPGKSHGQRIVKKKKYSFRAHRTTLKLVIDQERVKSRLYSWLRFIAV